MTDQILTFRDLRFNKAASRGANHFSKQVELTFFN